jgi:UDP:flavonoid glycosyltransferase YjiC (YdhE family)
MSRVLAASFVSPGQSFPVVGVALELQRRGHDVAYWAPAGSDGVMKSFGLPTVHAGHWRGGPSAGSGQARQLPDGIGATVEALAAIYLDRLDDQLAEFGAVLDDVRPDVALTGSMVVGMLLAAEAASVPCASVTPTTYHADGAPGTPPPLLGLDPRTDDIAAAHLAWCQAEAPVLDQLAQARAGLGLPPRPGGFFAHLSSPDLHLIPSTPLLELPRPPVPDHVRYVGPCAVDAASQFHGLGPPPEWTPTRPAALVTGGTVMQGGDFVGDVTAALRDTLTVVALTWMYDADRLHDPPSVLATRYLPMARVLPDVDVVVSNGGSGGVIAALAHGRPLVVAPGHSDQGDNAVRIAAAGVGVHCDRDPRAVKRAVDEVLGDPRYAARAAELADDLRARGGAGAAASLVEALGSGGTVAPGRRS